MILVDSNKINEKRVNFNCALNKVQINQYIKLPLNNKILAQTRNAELFLEYQAELYLKEMHKIAQKCQESDNLIENSISLAEVIEFNKNIEELKFSEEFIYKNSDKNGCIKLINEFKNQYGYFNQEDYELFERMKFTRSLKNKKSDYYSFIIIDIDNFVPENFYDLAKQVKATCIVHSTLNNQSKQIFIQLNQGQIINKTDKGEYSLRRIQSYLNQLFNGDNNFKGHIAKNPLCDEKFCFHKVEWLENEYPTFEELLLQANVFLSDKIMLIMNIISQSNHQFLMISQSLNRTIKASNF